MQERKHKPNKIMRKVSGIERYFYRRPNANLIIVARIKGSITADELNAALVKVRARHPFLGVRILQDEQGID